MLSMLWENSHPPAIFCYIAAVKALTASSKQPIPIKAWNIAKQNDGGMNQNKKNHHINLFVFLLKTLFSFVNHKASGCYELI